MGPPHTPEPVGAVPKQGSMELGGQNWVPQKHKLRPKICANFLSPSFDTICLPRDAISNTLIQRARETWEAHMTRPFFQPKSSPFQAHETTQKSKPHPKLRLVLFKKLRC